ncbi:Protein CBG06662 [Caenorhabditis briggsae]|uniref:Protein CBG06662 n=3 Tax=Caenorhabditis briggsae TaxID=6238 RepID=A8X2S9_CAEBR|nr:Protein CBG06662 [Caenorhabditis briggsae]ULT88208.1 hypothetical protein L3Y34_007425 [Caenorhabditis briggsae]CAP26939.1 Protein CBG06662 [Caenorhabditis briggsae]
MGVIGLTAVEVLAGCLGLGLVLAILIVVCNCVSTCCETISHRRKKRNQEKLPEDYVDEIHRLLHRNQKPCDYDCVVVESGRQSANLEHISDTRLDPKASTPPVNFPIGKPLEERDLKSIGTSCTPCKNKRMESEETINTNTTNSQSTITASENGEAMHHCDGKSKRRTWGRLSNSLFDTVMMPSLDTTTTEDTTGTANSSIDNLRFGIKIETTV